MQPSGLRDTTRLLPGLQAGGLRRGKIDEQFKELYPDD